MALNDVYNGFRGRRRLTEPSWKEFQMLRLERSESLQTLIVARTGEGDHAVRRMATT